MSKSVKNQQEFDGEGLTRPSIESLDGYCVAVTKAEVSKKKVVDKLKQAKANLDAEMVERRDAGDLEATSDTARNEHSYTFRDGEKVMECFIRDTTEVGFREHSKPKAEKPDLKVVNDGSGELE